MALKLFQHGMITVSSAGTAVPLQSGTEISATSMIVQADPLNTGAIYIGDSNVDSDGITLSPGDSIPLGGTTIRGITEGIFLNDVYIDAETNGNAVRVAYYKRRD